VELALWNHSSLCRLDAPHVVPADVLHLILQRRPGASAGEPPRRQHALLVHRLQLQPPQVLNTAR
jgi:hypothetical protein